MRRWLMVPIIRPLFWALTVFGVIMCRIGRRADPINAREWENREILEYEIYRKFIEDCERV